VEKNLTSGLIVKEAKNSNELSVLAPVVGSAKATGIPLGETKSLSAERNRTKWNKNQFSVSDR
jgi:hypothetical protein